MALQNYQYDQIMRLYSQKQVKNQRILARRREELYSSHPRLASIDAEIGEKSMECLAGMLSSPAEEREKRLSELRSRISVLSEERSSLLAADGYPADYLELPCDCPLCRDTGFVGGKKCVCFRQAEIALLYSQSNLQDLPEDVSFSRFSLDYYSGEADSGSAGKSERDMAKAAYDTAVRFVRDFDTIHDNLFLYGDTGMGKTFLSHCIARALLDSSHLVLYFTAPDLFAQLAGYTFSPDPDRGEKSDILGSQLLIIDDLGTELTNSFVSSQLFQCVNERLIRQKSTLISTNLTLGEFANIYSERTFSRISGSYQMCKLVGKDIRMQKRLHKS